MHINEDFFVLLINLLFSNKHAVSKIRGLIGKKKNQTV